MARVIFAQLIELDHWLRLLVVTNRLHWLNPVMWAVSEIGRGGSVWLAAGLGLTMARRLPPRGLIQLALAILLASLVTNQLFKPLIGRERPFVRTPDIQVVGGRPNDASFPSGHSANAFAGAYVLSRIVPAAQVVWWTMVLAIAHSRVYLGVHYPLDVLGGAVVGLLCGFAVCRGLGGILPERRSLEL